MAFIGGFSTIALAGTRRTPMESLSEARRRYDQPVPEIARFFGIVIHMFVNSGAALHRPRFHAHSLPGRGSDLRHRFD
jgi:hypothetical protein